MSKEASFSSKVKDELSNIGFKRECCEKSFDDGYELREFGGECDRDGGAYIRGVFIRCGNISEPNRNFMLSFLPKPEFADYLEGALDGFGLPPHRSTRKGKPILYYKASESIEDVIAFIGGTKVALDIMRLKVLNDVRNNTNRLCNAETANMDRIARAAAEQSDAIKKIERHGALQNLSPELREIAELRLQNPDISLSELNNMLREPLSKSGLNYRFRKLIDIAESLEING